MPPQKLLNIIAPPTNIGRSVSKGQICVFSPFVHAGNDQPTQKLKLQLGWGEKINRSLLSCYTHTVLLKLWMRLANEHLMGTYTRQDTETKLFVIFKVLTIPHVPFSAFVLQLSKIFKIFQSSIGLL